MGQHDLKSPAYTVTQATPLRHNEYSINDSSFEDYEPTYRPDVQSYYEQKPAGRESTRPISDCPEEARLNYKPCPLKWSFLLLVLLFVAGLIGVVEYACRTLPAETDRGVVPNANSATAARSMVPRHTHAMGLVRDLEATPTPTSPSQSGSDSESSSTTDQGDASITFAATRPQSDYGKDGTVTISNTEPSTREQGDYGNDGSATVTPTLPASNFGDLGPTTIDGVATTVLPTYIPANVQTLTDSLGNPTATVVNTPDPISIPTSITLTDSKGRPTATLTSSVVIQPTTSVLTNSQGIATATLTQYPTIPTRPPSQHQKNSYYISKAEYVIGFFLPTILSVILTIPIRMIDVSAHQMQPFHELTHAYGADARDSLCQHVGGIHAVVQSVRSIFGGKALIFLTTLLAACSALLVPLSSEAVALMIHGSCTNTSFKGCAMTLGVFLWPARVTMAVMGLMGLTLLIILLFLRNWSSGVASNPWSIGGMAALSTNLDLRALFSTLPSHGRVKREDFIRVLEGTTFRLGSFINQNGVTEYGIMILGDSAQTVHQGFPVSSARIPPADRQAEVVLQGRSRKHHQPFFMLSILGRLLYILLTCGLLAVILYYNNTGGDTPFERFMDNQGFGVRFLFTTVGIGITFFWGSFFTSIAIVSPYHLLSVSPQYARNSILLSPPSNALTGFFSAIRRRHFFMAVVALTSLLSEFMPILLNNIPFRITQTYVTHLVCTWLAVGILSVMLLVVLASFLIKWPHMPADISTIAGSIYYVFDSGMLWSFEGLGSLRQEERDWRIKEMGMRYAFGEMTGVTGTHRIGVDAVEGRMP